MASWGPGPSESIFSSLSPHYRDWKQASPVTPISHHPTLAGLFHIIFCPLFFQLCPWLLPTPLLTQLP